MLTQEPLKYIPHSSDKNTTNLNGIIAYGTTRLSIYRSV